MISKEELYNRFTYHKPDEEQIKHYDSIRSLARILAEDIVQRCPESREQSLALSRLEEAVFWANASIARNSIQVYSRGEKMAGKAVWMSNNEGGYAISEDELNELIKNMVRD